MIAALLSDQHICSYTAAATEPQQLADESSYTRVYLEFATHSTHLLRLNFNHFKCQTSLGDFKSCYSQHPLPSDHNSQFTIHLLKGQNFKIGLSPHPSPTEGSFADYSTGIAYYSTGQLRGMSSAQYGLKFEAGDRITCYLNVTL